MRGLGGRIPLRLHTQTLNYMLVHEHMGGSVCINTHGQTQRRLWAGHWGLIEDSARAFSLIKFTVLVLVRFSRENKHFLTPASLATPTRASRRSGGMGPCWHTLKLRCGGGGLPSVEQLLLIMEGDFAEACFTPCKVKVDKPKIIH